MGRTYGTAAPITGPPSAMRFDWRFDPPDAGAFTGYFLSLFGLTDTRVTFDGTTITRLDFPEHGLDLDRIDGVLNEPGGPRGVDSIGLDVLYGGLQPVTLKLELQDDDRRVRFQRFVVAGSPQPQRITWQFRSDYREVDGSPFDLHRAKVLGLLVEREHVADGVHNPDQGSVDLRRVSASVTGGSAIPTDAAGLLDLQDRRSCQYFVDWASRKAGSIGMPQDRSTFADLLTVGGAGFALPAFAICAERNWISRADAAARAVSVLRCLDDPAAFGPEPVGRLGYKGFFYHSSAPIAGGS